MVVESVNAICAGVGGQVPRGAGGHRLVEPDLVAPRDSRSGRGRARRDACRSPRARRPGAARRRTWTGWRRRPAARTAPYARPVLRVERRWRRRPPVLGRLRRRRGRRSPRRPRRRAVPGGSAEPSTQPPPPRSRRGHPWSTGPSAGAWRRRCRRDDRPVSRRLTQGARCRAAHRASARAGGHPPRGRAGRPAPAIPGRASRPARQHVAGDPTVPGGRRCSRSTLHSAGLWNSSSATGRPAARRAARRSRRPPC